MTLIAGIGFAAPWLLLALLALPILWILLRAVPPAPKRQIFPAVTKAPFGQNYSRTRGTRT